MKTKTEYVKPSMRIIEVDVACLLASSYDSLSGRDNACAHGNNKWFCNED